MKYDTKKFSSAPFGIYEPQKETPQRLIAHEAMADRRRLQVLSCGVGGQEKPIGAPELCAFNKPVRGTCDNSEQGVDIHLHDRENLHLEFNHLERLILIFLFRFLWVVRTALRILPSARL